MYVKTDKDHLQQLKLPEMEDTAEFSSNNIAQVSASDGEVLLAKDGFSEHTPN